ncbi:Mur ligase domain-containing protein [Candidatus Saccharibacteria bacterium]|nr:Mur ligase domain-containing protein [Candidatus Saccharibacteria bacterium]
MNIYFSGIAGSGIGPLALIARSAGYQVSGSDLNATITPIVEELKTASVNLSLGPGAQDGDFLKYTHENSPIDWFIYTSALPADHPELLAAQQLGIKTSKRDEFLPELLKLQNFRLVAVAGTHGKTTTTSMLIWAFQQLNLPASHLVGTTLTFASSGHFTDQSDIFLYECCEFDRHFLHYSPYLSLITTIEHDHPDTYPTEIDYLSAFTQFISQSQSTITWLDQTTQLPPLQNVQTLDQPNPAITLLGEHNRKNATLALATIQNLHPEIPESQIITALNSFPGSARRFERLVDNLYTDYAHHPSEVRATIQLALEKTKKEDKKLAIIYQPHQNIRQHQSRHLYSSAFNGVDRLLWLPTYLTREDPNLPIITPTEFISSLENPEVATPAELDKTLISEIKSLLDQNYLVLFFGAGDGDTFLRTHLL